MTVSAHEVLEFWISAGPQKWFAKDDAFDALCADFEAAHHIAARGECTVWEQTADSALALILLLDQIPRNIFRGSAHAFATDGLAQSLALRAVAAGYDRVTPMPLRIFYYMPLEHAEDIALQERCVALMEAAGDEEFTRFAKLHRDIIARFGRFPHRNAALGRASTPEEDAFLAGGGFKG
jgi:uncharacterized protein (DUF924 family)